MEPDQAHFNKHFLEMAEGKLMEGDLPGLARRGLGGHRSNPRNYKMSFDPNPKDPRPIQNVTSQVASYVNQAKSKMGEAIKLGENETGISAAINPSTGKTSSSKKKRKSSKKSSGKVSKNKDKKKKNKKSKKDQKDQKKKKDKKKK